MFLQGLVLIVQTTCCFQQLIQVVLRLLYGALHLGRKKEVIFQQ